MRKGPVYCQFRALSSWTIVSTGIRINGSRMTEVRNKILYASDCAKRRAAGEAALPYGTFASQRALYAQVNQTGESVR